MKNTTNYGLKKPDGTDMYNVEHFNENADIIDAKLKNHTDNISIITGDVATLENLVTVAQTTANTATDIAKGKNQARVFATTAKMNEWLAKAANKGVANVGDNLYIVDVGVPDWWISEVRSTPNADGRYYEIAQLETQKVDLTTIEDAIDDLEEISQDTRETLGISKNLLQREYTPQTSEYKAGIAFTHNNDGSITCNGTATAETWLVLKGNEEWQGTNQEYLVEPSKAYIITGTPEGGDENSYCLRVRRRFDNGSIYPVAISAEGYTTPIETVSNQGLICLEIYVASGAVLNNVTFYPMIRETSILDDTYEPYRVDRVGELESDLGGRLKVFSSGEGVKSFTTPVIENGMYLFMVIESTTTTDRNNPSFGAIYINNNMVWININKSENSQITNISGADGTVTIELSSSKYVTFSLLKMYATKQV